VNNQGEDTQPLDCFIELHNNAPEPYDLSGWCIRYSGTVDRLIIIPRGPDSIIAPNKYFTVGRSTNHAFSHLDLVITNFTIPASPFIIEVQDPGGRTSDTVDFFQRQYLPAGANLPLIRRSAVRTENFFGGDDGGSYDSWDTFGAYETSWDYANVRPNYRSRVFCSPGN
jgi:hypothetical protein